MSNRALMSVRRDFHGALFGEGQEMLALAAVSLGLRARSIRIGNAVGT